MRRALFALLASLLPNVGCSQEQPPETPKCNGFRNQCVAEAALGAQFGCARLRDRSVWCWGRNDEGQLGYATSDVCPVDVAQGTTRAVACHTFPLQVPGLEDVTAIASGDAFTCALQGNGGVRCWGANAHGQLGNGKTITSQTPVAVEGLGGVSSIVVGPRHACALVDSRVFCWGANDFGQLGDKNVGACNSADKERSCATRPVEVTKVRDVVALAVGGNHTCALTSRGRVACWGDNRWGQLGVGSSGAPTPTETKSDEGPRDEDAGADAASSDAGDGGTVAELREVHVTPERALTKVVAISAGADHTCALRDGGDVYCWGRDDHNELGATPPAATSAVCPGPCSDLALKVEGLPPVNDPPADAGADASDATADTSVEDAASEDAIADATSDAGSDAGDDAGEDEALRVGTFGRSLSSGHSYTCLRNGDGTVRCWGSNALGQLGDGRSTTEPRGVTLVIASPGAAASNPLQNVAKVFAGAWSACALLSDNSLRCWGTNQSGALGGGHYTPQQGPIPVAW